MTPILLWPQKYNSWSKLFITQRRNRSVRLGSKELRLSIEDCTFHSGNGLHVCQTHQDIEDHEGSLRVLVRDYRRVYVRGHPHQGCSGRLHIKRATTPSRTNGGGSPAGKRLQIGSRTSTWSWEAGKIRSSINPAGGNVMANRRITQKLQGS